MSASALDTPMMRQYLAVKAQHPDAVLFYRMGDFYEMFLADAEVAAPLLDIALTTRDRNKPDPVPMCGVPVHAAEQHVRRLTELGHKVAICEQVEDARKARGKRLVRREVIEVITPGLVGDPAGLEGHREVPLAALWRDEAGVGLALLEASTADFRATSVSLRGAGAEEPPLPRALAAELVRAAPREVLVAEADAERLAARLRDALPGVAVTPRPAEDFAPESAPARPEGFDGALPPAARRAAAAALTYVAANQPHALDQIPRLRPYTLGDAMVLDASTRAHLELFENGEDGGRRGTLIERLDLTATALGARRLARWLAYPLLDPGAIRARQDGVAFLVEADRARARLREALRPVRDLERLLAKAARPTSTPRDLVALRASLGALPAVAAARGTDADALLPSEGGDSALRWPAPVPAAAGLLANALVDEPPALARGSRGADQTGFIREGYRPELDALRSAARDGRAWIARLEAEERERTGIPTLKVRFHPVHGYALEVTKAHLARVPEDYERKQTLANAERFTTPALRRAEEDVRGAHDKAAALEREIFEAVRSALLEHAGPIRDAAEAVAELDAAASLAEVARRDGWVRPEVHPGLGLEIRAGRHPVVEAMLARRSGEEFVPNDADLDPEATQLLILTGPNMSGKSTYLRQVALLVLLAQMGSFVPAASAAIGVVDRVFTRVGASDRLARGESTFMVEMRETAEILGEASARSLVILDEIGRGTSTFDGLSIAWAVAEYLHDTPALRPRTLFATHYHELTDLARTHPRVRNAHFEAREWGEEVIFLRRLVAGGASRSFGIQVARLAGLPRSVVTRAREILRNLEGGELDAAGRPRLAQHADGGRARAQADQLGLFPAGGSPTPAERDALERLRGVDPERITPVEALNALHGLVERLRSGGEEA